MAEATEVKTSWELEKWTSPETGHVVFYIKAVIGNREWASCFATVSANAAVEQDPAEAERFAHLIAAAPETTDALAEMVRWAEVQCDETDGFVHCLMCGTETDPQDAMTEGARHHEACPVPPAKAALQKARGAQ
jgi:hypothetical protein